jgi:hypothetical protein
MVAAAVAVVATASSSVADAECPGSPGASAPGLPGAGHLAALVVARRALTSRGFAVRLSRRDARALRTPR